MAQKPRPCLQDMPFHIKRTIADNLEQYFDKMALRSFNTDFRQIIRDPVAHIEEIELWFNETKDIQLKVELDEDNVLSRTYKWTESGCLIKKDFRDPGQLLKGRDYAQVALEELQALTNSSNLTADKLDMSIYADFPILAELKPGKLKIKEFHVLYTGNQEQVLPVLAHLDTEFLKHLNISMCRMEPEEDPEIQFRQLVQLDQWKQLEHLKMCEILAASIPAEHWWHVPDIELTMDNLEPVPAMIEHFRRCETFQNCEITTKSTTLHHMYVVGKELPWVDHKYCLFTVDYPVGPGQFELGVAIRRRHIFIGR